MKFTLPLHCFEWGKGSIRAPAAPFDSRYGLRPLSDDGISAGRAIHGRKEAKSIIHVITRQFFHSVTVGTVRSAE